MDLVSAASAINSKLQKVYSDYLSMSPALLTTLIHIHGQGEVHASKLVNELAIPNSTVYAAIREASEKGLIEQKTEIASGRKFYTLTPKGKRLLAGNQLKVKEFVADLKKIVTPEEQKFMQDIARRLTNREN